MPFATHSDLQANILKVMAAGGPPLAAPAISKSLPVGGRPPSKVFRTVLEQMANEGLLVRTPGKTDKYVMAPVQGWARATLRALLASGPQTEARLRKALTAGHEHLLGEVLEASIAAGEVFCHPALTASGKPKYALHPADPFDYLVKDLDKLLAAVARKGFSPEAVRASVLRRLGATAGERDAAVAQPQGAPLAAEVIVEAMRRLEPRIDSGAAVSIARLRHAVGARTDKPVFDSAVLALAERGILELQSHAWPARLTAEEQRALIGNGRGGWFDSAALRSRAA